MNHTPGLWKIINHDMVVGPEGQLVADCERTPHCERPAPPTIEGMANAAHIVHCVNVHDELLKALKNALNVLAGIATGDLKTVKADSPAIAQCRQAISKATNGEDHA